MKRASCLLCVIALAWSIPSFGQPAPRIVSPEVSADRKVTFRIRAPKAAEVTLRGEWMEGPAEKLTKDDQGIWSVTLGPLPADLYSYAFSVDGVKTIDPVNPSIKPGIAGSDSLVFIPGEESKFEDNLVVPHGQIRAVWYASATLQSQRRMHVYTPPGYDGSTERYPVLYLLHGAGDEDSGWSTVGRAGFILDNLLAAKKASPMIVVMPNGSMPRPATMPASTPGQPLSPEAAAARQALQDRFTNELMKDVIPQAEKTFRVIADRDHRAIAGLSMGGGQTLRIVTVHPDQFAYAAVWSMGIGQDPADWEKRNEAFLGKAKEINSGIKLFSISVGEKDFTLAGAKSLDEVLTKAGIRHELKLSGGGHTWINWRHYLNDLAPRLFVNTTASTAGPATKPTAEADNVKLARAPAGFDSRRRDIPRGKVETIEYDSKTVGVKRKATVYTPPGYAKDGPKLPVLYLLHGIGDTETGWTRRGVADAIMDNLIADKKSMAMIVVMPNGRASAEPVGPNPMGGNAFRDYANFENDLIKDLIPYIEKNYAAQPQRESRALAGLSMGGGQSLNFGLAHLETFAWVGGFSSAPNTGNARQLVRDPAAAKEKLKLLWISCGDRDNLMNISSRFHTALDEMKVPHVWHIDSGVHEWPVWKSDLYWFSQLLFR